jgi:hypothetical protein
MSGIMKGRVTGLNLRMFLQAQQGGHGYLANPWPAFSG